MSKTSFFLIVTVNQEQENTCMFKRFRRALKVLMIQDITVRTSVKLPQLPFSNNKNNCNAIIGEVWKLLKAPQIFLIIWSKPIAQIQILIHFIILRNFYKNENSIKKIKLSLLVHDLHQKTRSHQDILNPTLWSIHLTK